MYWNKDVETLDRGALERMQLERLNATLTEAANAPFYRERFRKEGIERVSSLADLRLLPFTTKADLKNVFHYGFLAVPLEEVVRLHSSSGTTGYP